VVAGDILRIALVNSLPNALRHYSAALESVLEATGFGRVVTVLESSVEAQDGHSKASRAGSVVRTMRARELLSVDLVIDMWPALGWFQPAMWRYISRRPKVRVVMHDPSPLRRQFGSGRLAKRLAAQAAPGTAHVGLIVHSDEAAGVVRGLGIKADQLPLPILPPSLTVLPPDHDRLLVLGQWKPTRRLDWMRELGLLLPPRGWSLSAAGLGWPSIEGWQVRSEFVPEDELTRLLHRATCLLVPYRFFFQSDIAIRALELGCPAVVPRTLHTEEAWGPDWPGLVAADSNGRAVMRAVEAAREHRDEVLVRAAAYRTLCVRQWREFLISYIDESAHADTAYIN
jgi:hypothetical protein